ncbi:MAG: SGNH/GDSL hydrolase family protein [Rubricoccaceae bacterium]
MIRALAVLFLATGCMSPTPEASSTTSSMRWLALGDSYTIGEGVEADDRWPHQVAARLRAEGIELATPEIIAVTGWTTDELAAGIDDASPTGPYDVVTLLIGVNDQYRERPVADYREPFRALLNQAIAFADRDAARVVVVSIPDWGVMPFAEGRDRAEIARQLDAYNALAREEADRAGAAWVDITPLSRTQGALAAGDGLHPSSEAYRAWADLITPAVRRALVSQ